MKKQAIILLTIFLIVAAALLWFFVQDQKAEKGIRPGAEADFYTYLGLPSFSGKFLEFKEAESEITILYFNTETMKINQKTFKIDKKTIFSKVTPDPYQPDLFSKEDFKKVKQEAPIIVFYFSAENKIPLARLIQVGTSF